MGPYFQQAARSAYWLLYRVCCAQHVACSKPRLARSVTANRLAVWTDKADALAALAARLGDGADASDRVTSPADPKPQVMCGVQCSVRWLTSAHCAPRQEFWRVKAMLLAPHDNAIMSARRREGDSRIAGTKGTVCDGRLGRDGYVVDKTYLSDLFSLLDRYDLVVPHDWQVALRCNMECCAATACAALQH